MRRLFHAVLVVVLCSIHPLARQAPSLLVRNVTLIDGNGEAPRAGVDVLVREGRIVSVDATASDPAAAADLILDGAGLTPLQAITAATRGAAHAIGVDDTRGTVTVGKVADLLIVDANPAVDIKNTRRIRYVIKDGRIVYTAGPKEP